MEKINKYYDFNGYSHKTTESLKWGIYFDDDKEITLIFDEEGQCIGAEEKDDVRILNTIEDIPDWKEFSIRG